MLIAKSLRQPFGDDRRTLTENVFVLPRALHIMAYLPPSSCGAEDAPLEN